MFDRLVLHDITTVLPRKKRISFTSSVETCIWNICAFAGKALLLLFCSNSGPSQTQPCKQNVGGLGGGVAVLIRLALDRIYMHLSVFCRKNTPGDKKGCSAAGFGSNDGAVTFSRFRKLDHYLSTQCLQFIIYFKDFPCAVPREAGGT